MDETSSSSLEASITTQKGSLHIGVSVTRRRVQAIRIFPKDTHLKETLLLNSNHSKIIHLVRHAQGVHNIAGEKDPAGYLLEENEDALLSSLGEEQCHSLENSTELTSFSQNASLLIVSPMRRTLQTATLSFPHLINKIPWIGYENVREQTGVHPCDRRRPISEHKIHYPHVDFSLVLDDEDQLYSRYPDCREPIEEVINRAHDFLLFLHSRSEREIVVVTHSAYLRHLLQHLLVVVETSSSEENLQSTSSEFQNFKNCEMRTFICDLSSISTSDV